jgi:3,4-dihydroxy 2-butanone 4-phosphate synthase / GTP cyclohydrolase II
MSLNTSEELIEDIRAGKMVILMDDEDRENEGDFILAAECVRPEDINFMASHGRGLICLPLSKDHCKRLNLPLMARNSHSGISTNFTVSIEAAEGVTTGISAVDRATTIRKAVAINAKPSDLVQPGHIFPLMAHPGGVLSRAGHTEAGCDLARLAGFTPAAVIVEILNDDGSMARRPDLEKIAVKFGLKIGTIADLIKYRTEHEKTVERMSESKFNTEFGTFQLFTYMDKLKNDLHYALVRGVIDPQQAIPVRVHIANPIFDMTGNTMSSSWPIKNVMENISKRKNGIVVILSNQIEAETVLMQIRDADIASSKIRSKIKKSSKEFRTIGLGSQILSDLGVQKMIVMSSPKRYYAISGFGLEIVDYITN